MSGIYEITITTQDGDSQLPPEHIHCIAESQRANMVLLSFKQRKQVLRSMFKRTHLVANLRTTSRCGITMKSASLTTAFITRPIFEYAY